MYLNVNLPSAPRLHNSPKPKDFTPNLFHDSLIYDFGTKFLELLYPAAHATRQ